MLGAIGLPSIPGASCSSASSALAAAGLGPICQVASGVSGLAGSATSQLAGFGVDSVLGALARWVSDGATWLLGRVGAVLGATTRIDLGATWFTTHFQTMAGLGGVVVVPLLVLGIVQAIHRQSASMLLRSVVLNVPLALVLTAVAVKLVQLGLALTDAMSAAVARGSGLDTGHFLGSVIIALSNPATGGQPATPAFVLFLGGLAVVFGAFLLWVELLIRAAAVYVAVLFLPLALASLAWPAISHWCRRLVDTLVALILGKFVIVAVLSLAAGALAGGTGSVPAGASGPGSGGGFSAVLGGAALLLLSAVAPWSLFRLLPFLEAGAVGHLEGTGQRGYHRIAGPVKGMAETAMRLSRDGGPSAVGRALALGAEGRGGTGSSGTDGNGPGPGGAGPRGPGADGPASGNPGSRGAGAAWPGGSGWGGPAPDLGPSSHQRSGTGTVTAPGANVPTWGINPASGRGFDDVMASSEPADHAWGQGTWSPRSTGPPTSPPGAPTGSASLPVTLPRRSGDHRVDVLDHDELGVRLVAGTRGAGGEHGR